MGPARTTAGALQRGWLSRFPRPTHPWSASVLGSARLPVRERRFSASTRLMRPRLLRFLQRFLTAQPV